MTMVQPSSLCRGTEYLRKFDLPPRTGFFAEQNQLKTHLRCDLAEIFARRLFQRVPFSLSSNYCSTIQKITRHRSRRTPAAGGSAADEQAYCSTATRVRLFSRVL